MRCKISCLSDGVSLDGLVKANGTNVIDEFGDFHGAGAQAASTVRWRTIVHLLTNLWKFFDTLMVKAIVMHANKQPKKCFTSKDVSDNIWSQTWTHLRIREGWKQIQICVLFLLFYLYSVVIKFMDGVYLAQPSCQLFGSCWYDKTLVTLINWRNVTVKTRININWWLNWNSVSDE